MQLSIKASLIIISISIFGSAMPSHAQIDCALVQAQAITCEGANSCKQTVAVNLPYSSPFGEGLSAFPVACCDTYIPTYVAEGPCNSEGIKREIAELGSAQPILVASCNGQYQLYVKRQR